MKKTAARVFTALVCAAALFFTLIPAAAWAVEIGTNISVSVDGFWISSHTEDFTLPVGESERLSVIASQPVVNYTWELSVDGGTTWAPAPNAEDSPNYLIADAQANDPVQLPYQYRVTVENAAGDTDSALISVLVSNDYAYRTIALRNGDTDVSAYMHDQTRLVITPLPDSAAAAATLEAELSPGTLALILCDVSLVNQNNQVVPYFGQLQVDFHVGDAYEGQTIKAYHLKAGVVNSYSGIVTGGVLSIIVNSLSPFMVEVPAAEAHTVTASAGAGGAVSPSGAVNVTQGSSKTFTFLPEAGYAISAVRLDGQTVSFTGNSYTLADISQNHSLSVSFRRVAPAETLHTLTISAGAHGSASPSGSLRLRHGDPQTIYFYPDENYELDELLVNGAPVSVLSSSYTLSAVEADTTLQASFRAAATQRPKVYKTVTASAGTGGSISPSGENRLEYGGDMYFYFIPNQGYVLDEVSVDGVPVTLSANSYHFVNVVDARTIHASFRALNTYTITASSGAHGSISPSGSVEVEEGESKTFTFAPDTGYSIASVTVDGARLSSTGSSYTFSSVAADHSISVSFTRSSTPTSPSTPARTTYYTLTASAGDHGSISPSGSVSVAKGGSKTFNFIPDEGYKLESVTVDGKEVKVSGDSYRFSKVQANHRISATFAPAEGEEDYCTVTVSTGSGGSVSPDGVLRVARGGSQTFYIIPDDGFELDSVHVNGEKLDIKGSQFTLDDIQEETQVSASFRSTKAVLDNEPGDDYHCFVCRWIGRSIAPWCWLIPLLILIAAAYILWFILRRKQNKEV